MNQSFDATIRYAMLALAMLFVANLTAAAHMAGVSCVWGATAAILATGLAYAAQHFHTEAAAWYEQHEKSALLGGEPFIRYQRAHRKGMGLQLASVAAAALSGLLFLVGAL